MEEKIELDCFMLNLNISDYYPDNSILFWLQKLKVPVGGKIFIVSFRTIKTDIIQMLQNETIIWVERIGLSFKSIENFIHSLNKEDIVIIVGMERLVELKSERKIAQLNFGKKVSAVHLQEDENWTLFSHKIDHLYEKVQNFISGLICICNVNQEITEKVNQALKDSMNMSICSTESIGGKTEKNSPINKLIRELSNKSLEDALSKIDLYQESLDTQEILLCRAIAYFNNGDITNAIKILKGNYDELTIEIKQLLIDMYLLEEEYSAAQAIFEEIYKEDNQQRAIYELGLKVYDANTKRYEELLFEGIKYQPDNLAVIECYANWLTEHEKFKEAATWYRRINTPYHTLVAMVNDLLDQGQTDVKIVKAYLYNILEKYPELKNEAVYRVALFALKENHYFDAYNILKEAELKRNDELSKNIICRKIDILKDTAKASKALRKIKPFTKEKDRNILIAERCELLFECINYFSDDAQGYYYWRNLLECQNAKLWKMGLKNFIVELFGVLQGLEIDDLIKKSYIANINPNKEHVDCEMAIWFLRASNCGELSDKELNISRDEIIKSSFTVGEVQGTETQKAWIKYYCAIGESVLNRNPQTSNNWALGILELINTEDQYVDELCSTLFLMSWGNSQYRLGNDIEGVTCLLIGIQKLVKTHEIFPVLEEGGNILSKYLISNEDLFNDEEKEKIISFLEKYSQYNESLLPVLKKYSNDTDQLIKFYQDKVEQNTQDIHWLIDLSNLIGVLVENDKMDVATKYIKNYYKNIDDLLEQRKDIAVNLLYYWGDIVIKDNPVIDNVLLGLELMDKSITYALQRRSVHHQEERAALAEEYDKVLRAYLCYASIYYGASDTLLEIKEKLKKSICDKISICLPMSVIEQKNYYNDKEIDDNLRDKDNKLKALKKEYVIMLKKNNATNPDVQKLANEIKELTSELVENHPYYKPLECYSGTDWEELQKVLEPTEVVYQYVLTDISVVSILITKDWIDVRTKLLDVTYNTPMQALNSYARIVEEEQLKKSEMEDITERISGLVAEHLCQYVFNYKISRIFVIPDVSKSMFPLSAVKFEGEYIVDKVEEIINFIDYKQIIKWKNGNIGEYKIINRLFGKPSDRSITYIKKWLQTKASPKFINILNQEDELNSLREECINGVNTVAIYGHGVREITSAANEGAQSIEGSNSMIQLRDILEVIDVENLFLISCVGGTPNNSNPEISSGTWTSIFERFSGNIVSCKWSVPTKETMELLEIIFDFMLNENMSIGKSLLASQKVMKDKGREQLKWAGVEYWIN